MPTSPDLQILEGLAVQGDQDRQEPQVGQGARLGHLCQGCQVNLWSLQRDKAHSGVLNMDGLEEPSGKKGLVCHVQDSPGEGALAVTLALTLSSGLSLLG